MSKILIDNCYPVTLIIQYFSKFKMIPDFQEQIRKYFSINHRGEKLEITLINPYLTAESIQSLSRYLLSFNQTEENTNNQQIIRMLDINIIECVTFDDQMLISLGTALPIILKELTLDFTGCQSIKGSGFLDLFENVSQMTLQKLHFDFSEIYDVNDFVLEGLGMLIESQPQLRELYLDFYEIDQITENGYMVLAESLTQLPNLKSLHLDFSANPCLTEDNLQLFFGNFPKTLTSLQFRILDIEGIGGGSFFRLAAFLSVTNLKKLDLTISTFSEINPKSFYSLFKEISQSKALQFLTINFSNTNMPNRLLGFLKIPPSVKQFSLDVSCNNSITDTDLISLISSITNQNAESNIEEIKLNFDFCRNITEDAISMAVQNLLEMAERAITYSNEQSKQNMDALHQKEFRKLSIDLTDRKYTKQFIDGILEAINKMKEGEKSRKKTQNQERQLHEVLLSVEIEGGREHKQWSMYRKKQIGKKKLIYCAQALKDRHFSEKTQKGILKLLADL